MVTGSPIKGAAIFQQRACITCHTVDGSASKLGPDLQTIWATFGREGVLKILTDPNKASASGYDTFKLRLKMAKRQSGGLFAPMNRK